MPTKDFKPTSVIFFILLFAVPVSVLSVGYLFKSGTMQVSSTGLISIAEDQTIYINSHGEILEPVTTPEGITYYKWIEGPFWPFYSASNGQLLTEGRVNIYIPKVPGTLYQGSTFQAFDKIVDTEANIKELFEIDNLYLTNGSAKVFYSKDVFDSRGTYTLLFKIGDFWYVNGRGLDSCMENLPSFVDIDTLLAGIVNQVNNGFLTY